MDNEKEVPYGACCCGCGQKTTIAKQTQTKYGHLRGVPKRFIVGHNARVQQRVSIEERLWSQVRKGDNNECWEWTGRKNATGYGKIFYQGKEWRVHKLVFIFSGGVLTEEQPCVLHRCDRRNCVNPAHLFSGSQKENLIDMRNKGRDCHGEKSNFNKISEITVRKIRELCDSGSLLQREIAELTGTSKENVSVIYRRKRWKHI